MKRRSCSICGRPGHRARRSSTGDYRCPYAGTSGGTVPPPQYGVHETRTFDSIAELVHAGGEPAAEGVHDHSHKHEADAWNGFASLSQACAMLGGAGAPELAAKVRALSVKLLPLVRQSPAQAQAYDVCGAAVDVERFLTGDPECMIDYASPAGTARTLDVYCNITISSGISTDVIIARGAAVCALIDALETTGVRVRVYWVVKTQCRTTCNSLTAIGLAKDYHAPLDIDLLAFILAHPAMLRQLGLHVIAQCPNMREATRGGYGEIKDLESVPEGAVYIKGMVLGQDVIPWSPENVLATIERIFNGGKV